MFSRSVILISVLGAAVVTSTPIESRTITGTDCPTLCIDGINECGVGWGDCFNICQPESSPVPPPCTKTEAPSYTAPPVDVGDDDSKPTPTSTASCTAPIICVDYINECRMMYGGCFPDCKPWPSFAPPPCPSGWNSTTEATPTASPGLEEDCERFVCVDHVNECGVEFGGCHPDCAPYPTYTPPPCP